MRQGGCVPRIVELTSIFVEDSTWPEWRQLSSKSRRRRAGWSARVSSSDSCCTVSGRSLKPPGPHPGEPGPCAGGLGG